MKKGGEEGLQDVLGIPKDGVGVEIIGGVEPEMELLLSIPFPLSEHIGVNGVRVAAKVAQKLKINLIPRRSCRFELQAHKYEQVRNQPLQSIPNNWPSNKSIDWIRKHSHNM